ncbi:MAG: hypothetical protein CM15mV135_270 [uncultured marine virus]|nr:MAG: hypothetical protein CM15mV135_270 [uncultured marine virus]
MFPWVLPDFLAFGFPRLLLSVDRHEAAATFLGRSDRGLTGVPNPFGALIRGSNRGYQRQVVELWS